MILVGTNKGLHLISINVNKLVIDTDLKKLLKDEQI